MELTIDEGENAVFIGIKMTEDGVESSVFNLDFSTDDNRLCSILALGAAASIINNTEDIEELGVDEFVKFTKSIFTKSEDGDKEEKITREDNVINISELLEDRKDK